MKHLFTTLILCALLNACKYTVVTGTSERLKTPPAKDTHGFANYQSDINVLQEAAGNMDTRRPGQISIDESGNATIYCRKWRSGRVVNALRGLGATNPLENGAAPLNKSNKNEKLRLEKATLEGKIEILEKDRKTLLAKIDTLEKENIQRANEEEQAEQTKVKNELEQLKIDATKMKHEIDSLNNVIKDLRDPPAKVKK